VKQIDRKQSLYCDLLRIKSVTPGCDGLQAAEALLSIKDIIQAGI